MSVFTSVSEEEMRLFLEDYNIGELVELKGIAQGITNTNYFVTTTENRYVLTVFEVLKSDELPFYLYLMKHLSERGVVAPEPVARQDGALQGLLSGKPACLISCLPGRDIQETNTEQCYSIGCTLAKMHLAGADFSMKMDNPRFNHWWRQQAERLYPLMLGEDAILLSNTIAFLNKNLDTHLPRGVIHADLFKDNVLVTNGRVTGLIDFYYACNGSFVYDLAITINDWTAEKSGQLNQEKLDALIAGYNSVRPLSAEEKEYLPIAQQAACIRFWVSRLVDCYFPAQGEMTYIKDPNIFREILLNLKR